MGNGASAELTGAYSGSVSFAGATGSLAIDHSANFNGTIGGQLAIGDVIDLADITAGAGATLSYSGNNSPGTLTVSDGVHTANIALLGNYTLANFTASSDGHGGTSIVDPPVSDNSSVPGIQMTDPMDAMLNHQLALFSQTMSSAFPSSGFGDGTLFIDELLGVWGAVAAVGASGCGPAATCLSDGLNRPTGEANACGR